MTKIRKPCWGTGLFEYELPAIADYVLSTGLDWIRVSPSPPRNEREELRQLAERALEAVQKNASPPPDVSWQARPGTKMPENVADVDRDFQLPEKFDATAFVNEGRADLSREIGVSFDLWRYGTVAGPLWSFYPRYGFEGMMLLLGSSPDISAYLADRFTQLALRNIEIAEALEADAVWIEDCLTDQIPPDVFRRLNVPRLKRYVREIHKRGMKSVYYYCGNPFDRFDAILEIGADAYHFEESKKHFRIDICDVVDRVAGGAVVFGNLDAIHMLPAATPVELEREIERQLLAGRKNHDRFVMSIGSPVTPGTTVERVREYTTLVRTVSDRL